MMVVLHSRESKQAITMAHPRGLTLRTEDRTVLEQWARSRTRPHRQVQRARMLLGLADGKTLAAVGAAVGATHDTVAAWRDRYLAEGLAGLEDRPRRGRPPVYTDADALAMWRKLRSEPPDGRTHWSVSLMARETGFSPARIHRWWREAGLQPHRVHTFKLSNDPRFEAKLRDVVAVLEKKGSLAS